MALISVTRADVRPMPGAHVERAVVGGGTVYVGDTVYHDGGTPSAAHLARVQRANAGTATTAYAIGIVVSAPQGGTQAISGDTIDLVTFGGVTGFTGMTPGDMLYQGNEDGRIADAAGTASHKIGRARSTTVIFVSPALTEA